MKLLLVNGNRTQAVTDHVVAVARAVAAAGTIVTGVTARFGADIVTAEPENVIAAHAVLDLLAEHHTRFDAAILAISFDSGLHATRDLVPIPVIGMTEAALIAAAADDEKIGVILFGHASLPLYQAHFARLPAGQAIGAIEIVEIASVASYLDTSSHETAVLAAVARLQAAGLNRIVICGAATAGLAARIQHKTSAALFDGIACAVATAERLIRDRQSKPVPRSALVRTSRVTGVSPALEALFARRASGN